MELRPELTPPALDKALVDHLAALAARIDGANPGQWEDDLAEFNRLAGTDLPFSLFQGIYGGEDHVDWVRRVLYYRLIKPAAGVTRKELVEVVRRAMPQNGDPECEAYQLILDANAPREDASSLFFYPPDPPGYDPETNTWGGGRSMDEYNPTPEQIVEWALTQDPDEE
jgi:hypothetical protein